MIIHRIINLKDFHGQDLFCFSRPQAMFRVLCEEVKSQTGIDLFPRLSHLKDRGALWWLSEARKLGLGQDVDIEEVLDIWEEIKGPLDQFLSPVDDSWDAYENTYGDLEIDIDDLFREPLEEELQEKFEEETGKNAVCGCKITVEYLEWKEENGY